MSANGVLVEILNIIGVRAHGDWLGAGRRASKYLLPLVTRSLAGEQLS